MRNKQVEEEGKHTWRGSAMYPDPDVYNAI
jgi:hypothetical protein